MATPGTRKVSPVDFGGELEPLTSKERIRKVMSQLECTSDGLSTSEAEARMGQYGKNELPSHEESKILKFLSYFWNPLAWTMEVAVILAVILADWADFGLILGLLVVNAMLGYWEEYQSGNAIKALQSQLTPTCKTLRDGEVGRLESTALVPGDVVLVRLGDIVPADCLILETENTIKVDQSSLTGESLPITRGEGEQIFSGSIVKMGEVYALVIATGPDTYFGKAAGLIQEEDGESHIYKILAYIGYFCISLIAAFVLAELLVEFLGRKRSCRSTKTCEPLENSLVLIIGGIPIAMPTVLSVTMALGARDLSKKNAIVSRLAAVEELAAMDVLCSDKTGTLTKNKLTLADPMVYVGGEEKEEVMFDAALASSRETEDAIDVAILDSLPAARTDEMAGWERIKFVPFDPVSKKTTSQMRKKSDGHVRWARKGAPQVILDEASNHDIADQVQKDIDSFASRGYRSLGVSISDDGDSWTMIGLIPMFDPPRDDTKDTITRIKSLGIEIRMITGDQVAIAKETARLIGLGDNIVNAKMKGSQNFSEENVMRSDGFAQVFPEHKFAIVKALLDGKHCVGMTGDGVNDAPALKKANIGIAVEGATDAARAAADIVLVSPGLSVIYHAVVGARKIFQRMKNYAMYSITSTVRIVLTFGILTLAFGWYFPVIAIAFLAILNDLSMISISRDVVKPSPRPDRWDMLEIFGVAIVLGTWLAASTIVLWIITIYTSFWTHFGLRQLNGFDIRGLIYLQVSISNLATIFVTRSQKFSWMERPGFWLTMAFLFSQTVNMFFGAYGLGGFPNNGVFDWEGSGWGYVLVAWIWSLLWCTVEFPFRQRTALTEIAVLPMDFLKFGVRRAVPTIHRLKKSLIPKKAEKPVFKGPPRPSMPGMRLAPSEERRRTMERSREGKGKEEAKV